MRKKLLLSVAALSLLAACTTGPSPSLLEAQQLEQQRIIQERLEAEAKYHEEQKRIRTEQAERARLEAFKQELSDAGFFSVVDNAQNIQDERYIFINIPSQILRVFENGQEVLRTRIIIGTEEQQTQIYTSRIWGVKLNPDWTVPPRGNIERRYTQLIAEGKSQQLIEMGIHWRARRDGTLQFYQPSGEDNVVGMVKFEMSSRYNIYLHDTNRRDLFNLPERTISNGCVRVEAWADLAGWLLGVESEKIIHMIQDPTMRTIPVNNIPVYMVYWTKELIDGKLVEWPDRYNKGNRSILDDLHFRPSSSS